MRIVLLVWLALAASVPTASMAQRAPRATAEGMFRYVRTLAPNCGRAPYLHEYRGENGEQLLVALPDPRPSERDQRARIRYRPTQRYAVTVSADACAHTRAEDVQVDGEPIAFQGHPIELLSFIYVNRYVTSCGGVDRTLYEFLSMDGSTRLLVASGSQELVPARFGDTHQIHFLRMPARTRRFSPNACTGAPPIALVSHGEAIAIGPAGDGWTSPDQWPVPAGGRSSR